MLRASPLVFSFR